jgi:hypothetical protein
VRVLLVVRTRERDAYAVRHGLSRPI